MMTYEFHPLPTEQSYGVEILRSEVGSTLHGTGLLGHEDHDEMGIYVSWPEIVIGIGGDKEQYIWRSAGRDAMGADNPSQPHDTDLCVYSLRKWVRLALSGNPTILLLLYAPEDKLILSTDWGDALRANRDWFLSRRAGNAFLGYMVQQRQRMTGERGKAGRVRVMPDGGVDWKYAMHMLRLGYQGKEYLERGTITLPIPEEQGAFLRQVRKGEIAFGEVIELAASLEAHLRWLQDAGSTLPRSPDVESVNEWLIHTHGDVWRHHGKEI